MDKQRMKVARPMALLKQGRTDWFTITNKSPDLAEVMIYDEIGYWGVTAQDFVNQLQGVTAKNITLRLNSPGGEVFDGVAIYNAVSSHPATVDVQIDGLAASIASVIAMAGDTITMAATAQMMIHDGFGMVVGNAADMRDTADLLDRVSDNIASIYAARTNSDQATWRTRMKSETWYSADEAKAAGLCDVVTGRKTKPDKEPANSWDLSIFANLPKRPEPRYGEESMPLLNEALPIHHTATEDSAWDGPAAVAAMPNDAATLRYCHAWENSSADDNDADDKGGPGDGDADDKKFNYKFPHHRTKGGPANIPACRNGLARLSNADIPDGDRAGVKAHLQAHIDDANKDGDDKTPNDALETDIEFEFDPDLFREVLREAMAS